MKCVKDRDFRETPKPFVIEGRPHLDATGKFKMPHTPGTAKEYSAYKKRESSKTGGRPKYAQLSIDEVVLARKGLAAGRTQEDVAKDLSVSARTLTRLLQDAPSLAQIEQMHISPADAEHTFRHVGGNGKIDYADVGVVGTPIPRHDRGRSFASLVWMG